jgi:hypothetical protein
MTIEAVVSHEQLPADTDRALVSFIWVLHQQRFQLRWESYWKILGMLDEPQAIARNE